MISRRRLEIANRKGRRRAKILAIGLGEILGIDETKKFIKRTTRQLRKCTKMCSRACCGNPRKFFKELTMQEKKAKDKYKYEITIMSNM